MYTISNILQDINSGILAHNMVESEFSYRLVYFINSGNKGEKHYLDTPYGGLRAALENIIKNNLTVTNNVVIAQATVRKNSENVSLLSKAYSFSLGEYFQKVCESKEKDTNSNYGRKRAQWC